MASVITPAICTSEWRQRCLNRSAIFCKSAIEDERAASVETICEPTKFVPPSLDEMIRVRAPAKQIENVHGISVEQAEQMLLDAEASKAKSDLLQEV